MSARLNTTDLKNQLLDNLERLSGDDIQEILDFVEFLLIKRNKEKKVSQSIGLDPDKDPILKLMGIADVDPFANNIDQELYGQ